MEKGTVQEDRFGRVNRYVVAVLLTAAAVGLRLVLDSVVGPTPHQFVVLFCGAAVAAAWYGGFRAGLLSVALGTLALVYLFIEPKHNLGIGRLDDLVLLGSYIGTSLLGSVLCENLHSARRRLVREHKLRRGEQERFRLTADAVNGIISEYDIPTGQVERSMGLYEILGYHADKVPSTAAWWQEQVHPDDQEPARRRFEEVASGNSGVTEYRLRHKDGRWLYVEDRIVVLKDGGGRPVRMVGCTMDVTDRKEAEAGRKRMLATLVSLVASAPVGIVMLDSDMRYQHINGPLAEMNGLSVEDHIGRTVKQVVPELYEQVEPLFRRVLGEGVAIPDFVLEGETPKAPGVKRVWRESWFPMMGPDGRPSGVGAIAQEITEQRRAESVLKISEVRYRRLFESAKDGILILDAHTATITDANPFMAETLGYSQDEFVGKELWQFGLFKDAEASKEAMRELQEKKYTRYEDLPLKTKAGRTIHVEFVSNVYDENGEAVIQCNIRDITQRRQTEQALAKSLTYADDIIATLREPFVVLDADLRVRTANRSFYDSFHVSKGETEGQFVYDLGNGQWDIPALRTLLDQVLSRSESVHDYEVEHTFPALGRKTMLLNARPFPPDSKHPELILLAVEDVSAVRERAEELAEANRQKDEFLATLAHELRNPLAPIRNGLQIMKLAGGNPDAVEKSRSMMERQVGQMAHLIDDLMDLSRISRGKIVLQKARLRVAEVVQEAVDICRPLIEERGHELVVDVPSEPLYVEADRTRLAQVFGNLLNNAVKYTEKGGRIRVAVERQGGDVVVAVEDNGVGIHAHMLTRVFDMFAQVDRSLEKSQGGLGIGLNIVKRLAEMHDGSIVAESGGHGAGSRFVVRLPVVLTVTTDRPDDHTSVPKAKPARRRILVVDDNVDGAGSLAEMMGIMGNDTQTAFDGLEAVAVAEAFKPDVILMDIGMPKLNGFEACRRIRGEPWGKSVLIVACTGWGQDDDKRKSQEAGFDFHMVKPVDPAALEKMLAELKATAG